MLLSSASGPCLHGRLSSNVRRHRGSRGETRGISGGPSRLSSSIAMTLTKSKGHWRKAGVPANLAARLVLLVPSAFAAVHYGREGIEFPTHFLVGPKDALCELPYAKEPGYSEAKALATRWVQERRSSLIARVLDWKCGGKRHQRCAQQGPHPVPHEVGSPRRGLVVPER